MLRSVTCRRLPRGAVENCVCSAACVAPSTPIRKMRYSELPSTVGNTPVPSIVTLLRINGSGLASVITLPESAAPNWIVLDASVEALSAINASRSDPEPIVSAYVVTVNVAAPAGTLTAGRHNAMQRASLRKHNEDGCERIVRYVFGNMSSPCGIDAVVELHGNQYYARRRHNPIRSADGAAAL